MRVGLVSCCKSKLSSPAPAEDFYTSRTFRARKDRVKRTCDRWFILSGGHGILTPETTVPAVYNIWLEKIPSADRLLAQSNFFLQLTREIELPATFEIHAGAAYYGVLEEMLLATGYAVEVPTRGLTALHTFKWLKNNR